MSPVNVTRAAETFLAGYDSTSAETNVDAIAWDHAITAGATTGYLLPPLAEIGRHPIEGPPAAGQRWLDRAAVHLAHNADAYAEALNTGATETDANRVLIGGPGCGCWPGPASAAVLDAIRDAHPHHDHDTYRPPFYCDRAGCDGEPHGRWQRHARADQVPPRGDRYRTHAAISGRGSGKSRAGAEWVHTLARQTRLRIALVGPTSDSIRAVMVEGESGLLATASPGWPAVYEPSLRRLVWSRTGTIATLYSAEEPDRLRGPQFHAGWIDEACWAANIGRVWDNLWFGLRLGEHPRVFVTTTPKPSAWLRQLVADELTTVTTASTYDNLANLSPVLARQVLERYEGTRLGRQEIHAEILEDIEGALWTQAIIDLHRVPSVDVATLSLLVGLDPSGSAHGDECGLVVVGRRGDADYYVLSDESGRMSPAEWSAAAIGAAKRYSCPIVAEQNYGGQMVEHAIRSAPGGRDVQIFAVTATRSKSDRAHPIAGLYERGQVHHVGVLPVLERQLCEWVPGDPSPDRMDALVHAVTRLMPTSVPATISSLVGRRIPNRGTPWISALDRRQYWS